MANENPKCDLCILHTSANPKAICLKGEGIGVGPYPLLVCLDSPNKVENIRGRAMVSDAADWLRWAFRRMSISNGVYLDYTVKCYTGGNKQFGKKHEKMETIEQCSIYRVATLQQIKPKAIIAMGALSSLAFVGQGKVGLAVESKWTPTEPFVREFVPHVWIAYSAGYPLQDPAESVGVFRTLWRAAEDAGLNPKINLKEQPFDYGF